MSNGISKHLLNTPAKLQWQHIGIKNHHGIALPLFSLHSETSCGIGEYPDLLILLPWCKENGFDIIQLLPLNDPGIESSPYSTLSAFALNPLHIGLHQLPYLHKTPQLQKQLEDFHRFNSSSQRINYSQIHEIKNSFLRNYYHQFGPKLLASESYQKFKAENKVWLYDYALFKALKIYQNWQSWELWPPFFKDSSPNFIQNLPIEISAELDYHIFLQFLCFLQFEEVKQQADKIGIFIKGDIPILISRESADVWCKRELFMLQLSAGAPPDMFSKDGQKWGFPLYNWEAISAHGYQWWIERLKFAEKFYHLFRVDHIVGFFRIWAIPISRQSLEGYFTPENRAEWIRQGETIMRVMLANSNLLPIGEDLGVVPTEVRENLKCLGICGTKVMRWERRWEQDKGYINPRDYPPESMTTVSTHDSETLQQWWQNQPEEAKAFCEANGWVYTGELSTLQRLAILKLSHHSGSLFHINLLQEYLALLPGMTWANPDDERINVPGIVSDLNWTYRFRPSVEEIVTNSTLKQLLAEILNKSYTS